MDGTRYAWYSVALWPEIVRARLAALLVRVSLETQFLDLLETTCSSVEGQAAREEVSMTLIFRSRTKGLNTDPLSEVRKSWQSDIQKRLLGLECVKDTPTRKNIVLISTSSYTTLKALSPLYQ